MWFVIKRLSLAFTLLLLCSGLLLFSDRANRETAPSEIKQPPSLSKKWKITFVTFVTNALVEEAQKGTAAGLREAGLEEGRDYVAQTYSAQGDIANLNNIMDAAINNQSDLIYTYTTPALQTAAKKAEDSKVLFTLAVNPGSWGFVKSEKLHTNITGIYVSLPAERMIEIVRQTIPNVRRLGTLFTPSESNSNFVMESLRKAAEKENIELIAVPASSTAEVQEAADSLANRDIDAICQIPDNSTGASFVSIANAAVRAKLPLFCFGTPQIKMGGAVAVAVDEFEAGRQGALLAARLMRGEKISDIPMQPVLQNKLIVNLQAAKKLEMKLPDSLLAQADEIIQEDGSVKTKIDSRSRKISKIWNIHLLEYSNILDVEESEHGIKDGFREGGLVENRDYRITVRNAQGDMVTLSSMIDSAITDRADLLMTMSTPTLQGALKKARGRPIVFTLVASAIAAGAGKSNADHLPNVTGVLTTSAYPELIATVRKYLPNARKLGTLFVPSETNSIYNREQTEKAARSAGFEWISVPVNSTAEVNDATHSLLSHNVDAICQIAGNLTASAFPSIAEPARRAKVPIFAFQTNQAHQGASVVVARDYYDGGRQAAAIAIRLMNGENPAVIPFQPLKTTRVLINLKAAKACNLSVPPELLKQASTIIR